MAPSSPDGAAFAASADAQGACLLFSALPPEIRKMVYVEFWRLSGLRQHVLAREPSGELYHSPCITDQEARDTRYEEFLETSGVGQDMGVRGRRLNTDWNIHWACEELENPSLVQPFQTNPPQVPWSSFLPALLTCKRMYLECIESIFDSITFVFIDQVVARTFLRLWSPHAVRSVEICLAATNFLTELYFPSPQGPPSQLANGPPVTVDNNPWLHLCQALASQTRLRRLHVWFDSRDLRPWHSRVVETRLFAALGRARADDFVLLLPELVAGDRLALPPGSYLEGEALEAAPFEVRRGPRMNNWRVHLSRVGQFIEYIAGRQDNEPS